MGRGGGPPGSLEVQGAEGGVGEGHRDMAAWRRGVGGAGGVNDENNPKRNRMLGQMAGTLPGGARAKPAPGTLDLGLGSEGRHPQSSPGFRWWAPGLRASLCHTLGTSFPRGNG